MEIQYVTTLFHISLRFSLQWMYAQRPTILATCKAKDLHDINIENERERKHVLGLLISLILHCNMAYPMLGLHIRSNLYIKGGDLNSMHNQQSIMVNSLMTKLFGFVIGINLHLWAQMNGKRAYMQCGFWKHHRTINYIVITRVLIELLFFERQRVTFLLHIL